MHDCIVLYDEFYTETISVSLILRSYVYHRNCKSYKLLSMMTPNKIYFYLFIEIEKVILICKSSNTII